MDIDPKDLIESAKAATEEREARKARLNAAVAITVAVLATFMGICKVKDDNIVQAMQQAQADRDRPLGLLPGAQRAPGGGRGHAHATVSGQTGGAFQCRGL
ncbi:MAG: DUF4337 family protein [Aquabacterium sp.]